jgi:signal transduction histidine kinase
LESVSKPADRGISTPPGSSDTSLSNRIATIAELAARTLCADRCAVAFPSVSSGVDDVVFAPDGDSRWDPIVNALLSALANRTSDTKASPAKVMSIERTVLSTDETNAIERAGKTDGRRLLAASAFNDGVSNVRIAIVAPSDRNHGELEASIELFAHAVLSEIALSSARISLEFWRSRGAERSAQAVGAKQELMRQRDAESRLNEAIAAARRAQPSERFVRFGELVAGGAGFDQWIVAVTDGGTAKIAATSPGLEDFEAGKSNSAMTQCFQRRNVIVRQRDRDGSKVDTSRQYYEDRILSGSYICLPFDAGAIALASRDGTGSQPTAEAIVERLAPLVSVWVIESELSRRDALVRRLALRMFVAIDEERARIARDLHDDQAQLIAAVKIALDGRLDAARPIFEQVEKELRRKTRELRPATLGSISLDEAIEREFARLRRAGIGVKLLHGGAVEKISRPVEQLCFQVVREALSNVIRHSRASSVEVAIEKIDSAARVSIIDDGRGIDSGKNEGTGIVGMRERLELMGGSLKVESKAGGTSVVAEIPELS